MADLIDQFLSQSKQSKEAVGSGLTSERLAETDTSYNYAPANLGSVFRRGVTGGARGLAADARYFKGLAQTIIGDTEGAENSIRNARIMETRAAEAFDNIETFGEFLEEPTLTGFATQIFKGTGQIVPSAVSSIASGGTGAIVGMLGKSAVTATGRAAAKKLVQDGLIKTMRGTATPDERDLANGVYSLFRNRAANAGFITGAGTSEFVPLSGQNLSEALEAGEELDPVTAFRAAAIGVPQAAVGVGGEIGIAKLLGKVATQRGKAESSGILAKLGKDIGSAALKSGAIEGTTEVIQEGMAVANRFALDDEYTRQEAALRLGEAAFVGFFGGGSLGGGAAAPMSAANSVFRGAEKLIQKGREAQVAQQIEEEQSGAVDLGLTTPESARDIAAQFNAMEDPNNAKQSVWVSGNEDTYNVGDGANGVTTVSQQADGSIVADPDGDTYAVFVPGRGTLMSKNVSLISEVLNDGASDRAIAKALGYSATMPPTSDQVVQVTDSEGNVVHEEATDSVGLDRAIESAKGMVPAGGKWEVVDLQAALERRKQRFEADDDVVVRDMEIDPDEMADQVETTDTENISEFGTMTEFESEEILNKRYQPRNPKAPVEETVAAREAYEQAFNESTEGIPSAPNSILNRAVDLKNKYSDAIVSISENADGTWSLNVTTSPDTRRYGKNGLPLGMYVDSEITQAKKSKFKNAQLVSEDGQRTKVNLQDLVQAGKRINETEGGTNFNEGGAATAAQAGLSTIMGQLLERGLRIEIDQLPLDHPSVNTETIVDASQNITLGQALTPRNTIPRGKYFYQAVDQEGNVYDQITIDPADDINDIREQQQKFRNRPRETAVTFKRDRSFRDSPFTRLQRVNRSDLTSRQKTVLQQLQNIGDRLFKGKGEPVSDTLRQRLFTAYTNDARFQGSFEQWYSNKIPTWIRSRDSFEAIQTGLEEEVSPEGEIERFAEDALRQTDLPLTQLPLTQHNIELGKPDYRVETTSSRRTDARPQPGKRQTKARTFGFREGSAFAAVMEKALSALKLKMPVTVITKSYWDGLSDKQRVSFFTEQGVRPEQASPEGVVDPYMGDVLQATNIAGVVAQQIGSMNDSNAGKYIGFKNHHLLVVNEAVGNELAQTIAAMHELGHALFREERQGSLANEGLRRRMYKAFLKAKTKDGAPAQYEGANGFEEWYSDQVAMWGLKLAGGIAAAKPRNQIESHFKRVVTKLRNMWNSLRNEIRQRFNPTENFSPDFDTYIGEVVNRSKENSKEQVDNWTEAFVVRELDIEVAKQAKQSKQKIIGLNKDVLKKGINLVLPADNIMRMLGRAGSQARKAAIEIANMMYSRSGEKGLGFLQLSTLQKNEFMNQLETILGEDLYSPENQLAFEQAVDDRIPTEATGSGIALTPKAKQIRLFLERMHDEYISKVPGNKIGKLKDYFPVRLDLLQISNNPKAFAQILFDNQDSLKPQKSLQEIEAMVDGFLARGDISQETERTLNRLIGLPDDDFNANVDPYDDNVKANLRKALKLTKGIPRIELARAGFLKPPQEALANYVRDMVKYVEWQRAIKDENGNDKLAAALDVLEKTNPEYRQKAEEILDIYLGYQKAPLSALMQQANSWLGFLQIITTLAFAAISSFSELAGPIINSREFGSLRPVALKAALQTMNRAETQELARQLGVVTSQSMAHAIIDPASQEYMGAQQRRWTDKWFTYTGLEWFTRFTREFGANMSKEFILYHAKKPSPDSVRYLKELGLTPEEVNSWSGNELSSPVGLKIKRGMQKFTESSVIRPNAAERPIWASDPRFMLIFQLKGFAYAYGKVIVGGILREVKKRKANPNYSSEAERTLAMTSMLALAAFAAMPFTMLGLELKELTKYSLAAILPGIEASDRYFRSDSMDWGSYMFEITDRTGLLGPWSLLLGAQTSAQYGGSAIGSFLGPTAETMEKLFTDGLNAIPDRMIPVYSQL